MRVLSHLAMNNPSSEVMSIVNNEWMLAKYRSRLYVTGIAGLSIVYTPPQD